MNITSNPSSSNWTQPTPKVRTAASFGGPDFILRIFDNDQNPLVTVYWDGRIEYGEGYNPDDVARRLWEAIASTGLVTLQQPMQGES